ncbi:MAG: hypothetical protein IT582_05215, partial [Opitutaceae bacterium]|nr:hypothetical protein [Opitutaceae bacterium]
MVSTEDGPLRDAFFTVGAETLIVNPTTFLTAGDDAAVCELQQLGRAIRWDHLDAVAVFDPWCGWALALAAARGIPTLFDCGATEPLRPDPTAGAEVRRSLTAAWAGATAVCFTSQTAARAQSSMLFGRPAAIVPFWFAPAFGEPTPVDAPRLAHAPLRAVNWLRRRHPDVAARWQFAQGPGTTVTADQLARLDEAWAESDLVSAADWRAPGLSLHLGAMFEREPLRPSLDAAATGIPLVVARSALTKEIFGDEPSLFCAEGNAMALAHALLAYEALPERFHRRAALLRDRIRAAHDPRALLPRWTELLNTVAAARG